MILNVFGSLIIISIVIIIFLTINLINKNKNKCSNCQNNKCTKNKNYERK